MSGIAMLLKQLAPSLDVPGLLAQFETVKKELPIFARGVKATVESTDKRLTAIESKVDALVTVVLGMQLKQQELMDTLLQFIATANHAPDVYPAGPSRIPEDLQPYNDGAGL